MKKAVIVVGSGQAGKSKTINKYFKPLVDISGKQQIFSNGFGKVYSQCLEERGQPVDVFLQRLKDFTYLVCPARPHGEFISYYEELKSKLEKRGYAVFTLNILGFQKESFYKEKANEILNNLAC